jgi:hypothetical protein
LARMLHALRAGVTRRSSAGAARRVHARATWARGRQQRGARATAARRAPAGAGSRGRP